MLGVVSCVAFGATLWWKAEPPSASVSRDAPSADRGRTQRAAEGAAWAVARRVLVGEEGAELALEEKTGRSAVHASAYLAGLRLLAGGDAAAAEREFERIPPAEIPLDLLYGPYRAELSVRPTELGPHGNRLVEAALEGRLPRLLEARVLARTSRLVEALSAYAATDPALWRSYDVENLALIAHHDALRVDVERVIWRALATAGLRRELEAPLRRVAEEPNATDLETRVRQAIALGPEARKLAVESLERMREVRELFLDRRYADLLERFGDLEPTEATTEMTALLFLGALRQGASHYAYRWGQEIKRRHPEEQAVAWVSDLTASLRDAQ